MPLNSERIYLVATKFFLAEGISIKSDCQANSDPTGKDGYSCLTDCKVLLDEESGFDLRSEIIEFFGKKSTRLDMLMCLEIPKFEDFHVLWEKQKLSEEKLSEQDIENAEKPMLLRRQSSTFRKRMSRITKLTAMVADVKIVDNKHYICIAPKVEGRIRNISQNSM